MSLLIFTRSNLFFALCPVLALVSLAACNDPPKKRPSAGNVLPSPKQADSTEAERAEQLKAQKEEADRRKKEAQEEAARLAQNPSGANGPTSASNPTGQQVAFKPKELTPKLNKTFAFEENDGPETCLFDKGDKITTKSEPIVNPVASGQILVEIEVNTKCALKKVSIIKSGWTGW